MPRGVRILRHAEHALDGIVLGTEALDLVHVRAGLGHAHGNVLDAQVLGDAEVTIVAGRGTQELRMLELAPRRVAGHALLPIMDEDGLHDVQARRAEHDRLLGRHADELSRQTARGGNALEATVVAAVDALVRKICIARQEVEHGTRDVHLSGTRLAARHVELEPFGARLFDLALEFSDGGLEPLVAHLLVYRLHTRLPYRADGARLHAVDMFWDSIPGSRRTTAGRETATY